MRLDVLCFVFVLWIFWTCHPSEEEAMIPLDFHAEYVELGGPLALASIEFSWSHPPLDSTVEGYQILVSSDRTLLQKNIGDLWDSGFRFGADSSVFYEGVPLPSGRKIWWKMKVVGSQRFTAAQGIQLPGHENDTRVVLLGDALISSMENYGFFEQSLLQAFPYHRLTFRNIGWPADDIYGQARSQFGSAQNTRSWQPPTAEEGFGSKVLMRHIEEANPQVLIIGYGSETAFHGNKDDQELFERGYERLLDFVDSLSIPAVLLSPPKQEASIITPEELKARNQRLEATRTFIEREAQERSHIFIDLFNKLAPSDPERYTSNGIHLNENGYRKMSEVILHTFSEDVSTDFRIQLDSQARISSTENVVVKNWKRIVKGTQFDLELKTGFTEGILTGQGLVSVSSDLSSTWISSDSIEFSRAKESTLSHLIKEKNRLYRQRLRPLNEAYIYLFRRHEMGHLSYEMDQLAELIEERERDIRRLLQPQIFHAKLSINRHWKSPKDYPEDEVPANIPTPDVAQELKAFTVSPGFRVNLFAADPMIANPINMNWDGQGRAWVATSSTYPHIAPGDTPNDRIVVLEDRDRDGRADTSFVFAEELLVPQSVMPVPGGAYVTSTTEFLFLADTNGDLQSDQKMVIFEGFGNADVHHMIHGLTWAPWGDLYFTQSIYINSFVETIHGPRRLNGSGVWYYRPETKRLEVFARGLINPWGHALDPWGQAFATDGAGSSGINYIFPGSAHATAVGVERIVDGLNEGTPKYTGAEWVYGSHFPPQWQGSIMTNDFRANRMVRYQVTPKSSGYEAEEVETVLHSSHRSFRPVDLKIGPDGALYIVDWYNPIIDHGEVDFHHPLRDRSHGRIWRLTHDERPLILAPDFSALGIRELLDALKSTEPYFRHQANRMLVAKGVNQATVRNWAANQSSDRARLEALWLTAAISDLDEQLLQDDVLQASDGRIRAAGVRMIGRFDFPAKRTEMLSAFVGDPHPQVRLEAIHALRNQGGLPAVRLLAKTLEYPLDENIDYALWLSFRALQGDWLPALDRGVDVFSGDANKRMYALLAAEGPRSAQHIEEMMDRSDLVDSLVVRAWHRLAQWGSQGSKQKVLDRVIERGDPSLLSSMGKSNDPKSLPLDDPAVISSMLNHDSIGVRLGILRLLEIGKATTSQSKVLEIAQDQHRTHRERQAAAQALIGMDRIDQVIELARSKKPASVRAAATTAWILKEPNEAMNTAIEILQQVEDPELARDIFNAVRRINHGPEIMTEALKGEKLPESVASVGLSVAQSSGFNLTQWEEALKEAGNLKAMGMEMTKSERTTLIEEARTHGNPHRGHRIYRRPQLLCATCHRINGIGGLVGPDLSTVGTYMTPNSLLQSLLAPNADIKQGYETVLVHLVDGQVLSGTLHRKTDDDILLRNTKGEIQTISNQEIEKLDVSEVSLMPANLTASLHHDELRDLLAYLMQLGQEN